MSKHGLFGWLLLIAGSVLWIYGYVAAGSLPLVNWQADGPKWVAEFLPNFGSEIGMALMFAGMVPAYRPVCLLHQPERPDALMAHTHFGHDPIGSSLATLAEFQTHSGRLQRL